MRYKPSYYNLVVEHRGWTLLFNGISSGLMRLPQAMAADLRPFLGRRRSRQAGVGLDEWDYPTFEPDELPTSVRRRFVEFEKGSVFLPTDQDEQQLLKDRYENLRRNSPLFVTITATMDCNLRCYYCYENRSKVQLSREGCDAILAWIQTKNRETRFEKLYTDWYGGEPMLNQDAIDYFSSRAIQYCESNGLSYRSSMISNGTTWPHNAKAFVERNRIHHVQFTLDGSREDHNKRRRYADTGNHPHGSFDTILETIVRLIGSLRIYLRINVDPWIGRNALDLVDEFQQRGWLEEDARFFPYLASIGPVTEHCGFLGTAAKVQQFQEEFDQLNHEFQLRIGRYLGPQGMKHLQYYPAAVKLNCAAVGDNSAVFGPDGNMYKCCLEVGDVQRAHAQLEFTNGENCTDQPHSLPVVDSGAKRYSPDRWKTFDPFAQPRCCQCQYFPICLGGCPKVRMDENEYYLKQQSQYWEDNFERILRTYCDLIVGSSSVSMTD